MAGFAKMQCAMRNGQFYGLSSQVADLHVLDHAATQRVDFGHRRVSPGFEASKAGILLAR
jgi:hypothetical protein